MVPESLCVLRDRKYSSFRQTAGYGCPSTRRQPPWSVVTHYSLSMPGPELGVIRQLMNRRHWTRRQRKNSSNPPRRSRRVGSMKQSWSIRHRLNKQSKVRCAQNAEDLQQLAPNTHEGHSVWRLWASWPDYRASIIDLPRELVRWYHIFWGSNLNETQKTSLKINESLLTLKAISANWSTHGSSKINLNANSHSNIWLYAWNPVTTNKPKNSSAITNAFHRFNRHTYYTVFRSRLF